MWKAFNIDDLKAKVTGTEPQFFEFLRAPQMSCAIYRLPAGSKDMQAPHLEDEVYLVIEGKARVRIESNEKEASKGRCLFDTVTI